MNNKRRNRIYKILESLAVMRQDVEEQASFDNLPYSFQVSRKGKLMEEKIALLSDGLEFLETAAYSLNSMRSIR